MCSQAFSDDPPQGVHGLIFLGWPLHPAGKPGTERAEHLPQVKVPMLFLQGSRDKLAEPDLLEPIVRKLPTATLHFVKGADHGFGVRKMDGRSPEEIFEELTDNFCEWVFS